MNKKQLENIKNLRDTSLRTLRILREIENGETDLIKIAIKVKSTPQLVSYYFKQVNILMENK